MDIGLGLGLLGNITSKEKKKEPIITDKIKNTPQYSDSIYNNIQINNNRQKIYKDFNKNFKNSLKPKSFIINDNWRNQNDPINNKIKQNVEDSINKDLKNLKNLKYSNNIIENMSNINLNNDNDSVFTNDDELTNSHFQNNNINTKMLDIRDKFMDDVISDYTKNSDDEKSECNEFQKQFEPLEFRHKGLPNTFNNTKSTVKIFNNQKIIDGKFKPNDDGRYGVTSDMTHDNMQANFKSKDKGFNPMMDKQWSDMSVRKVELFTGSDQNPQFKHKAEVKPLFNPITNKVDSVTGTPVFTDFYESRFIPSDKRQGEKPFQPIMVSPGLNLGYNQSGATGKQDLYRVLPKTVDELRPLTNPKVSYKNQIIPGQKGNNRGITGATVQYTPDRFFVNTKESLLPTNGDFTAPAIYGKYLAPQTNRSISEQNTHLNPISNKENNTPELLQGLFRKPFKKSFIEDGPRNINYDTKGQNINRNFIIDETKRNTTNEYIGTANGNKYENFLANYENAVPQNTIRDQTSEVKNLNNTKGNFSAVPLVNFLNIIPDITKRQILLEDNGKNNISNVSNSIKSYLFNSINSIPDETLRSILTEKIILTNTTGNKINGYLFNNENSVNNQNMRNLSENNLILTTISNKQQNYLFNNLNSIPDPTIRELVNTLWGKGGLNIKGTSENNYLFNYDNSIPEATLREITENIIQLTNFTGPSGQLKGYLYNYINSIPDTTMKELTEDKIILNSITPIQVKNYLYNYLNSMPDTTLRELTEEKKYINNLNGNFKQGTNFNFLNGLPDTTLRELTEEKKNINNLNGNFKQGTNFNYLNGIPEHTLRNLIEDIIKIGNINGNYKTGYLVNYINSIPDNTLREITENTQFINNINPIQVKGYLLNYLNSTPDITIKELTENNKYINNQKGNYSNNYLFNYKNGIPDTTIREIIEDTKYLNSLIGNKKGNYLFNNDNSIPFETLRELTENLRNITGIKSNELQQMYAFNYDDKAKTTTRELIEELKHVTNISDQLLKQNYLFNFENGTPDFTNRNCSENTKNITGQGGNYIQNTNFNYKNGTPDFTNRNYSENTKNITGSIGNYIQNTNFNYENGTPDFTNRNYSENTKNIVGTKGNNNAEYMFNYDSGIPDFTNRDQTTITKNITGTRGNADQNRSRLDFNNALLNVEKEVIAKGRDPVPVKNNKGPVAIFTEYVFCDDNASEVPLFSGVKPNSNIKNEYYFG